MVSEWQQSVDNQVELKQKLKKDLSAYLNPPERIKHQDSLLPKELGDFLVDQDLIKGIDIWRNSWGFKYENGKIYIAENKIPIE